MFPSLVSAPMLVALLLGKSEKRSITRTKMSMRHLKPPAPKKPTNEFHKIRERELKRERDMLRGAPPDDTPQYFTPSLKEICAKVIADTFERQPAIDGSRDLDEDIYKLVIDQLSTDLPLEVTVPRVKLQDYWRACCEARWSLGQLTSFTKSKKLEPPQVGGWKRVYLERNLEEFLMNLDVNMSEKDEEQLVQLCMLCGSEIHSLNLTHLRCHIDLADFFAKLPHLEELKLTYGVVNAGVAYRMDMLKMRQTDVLSLQKVLRYVPSLRVLALPGNCIDSDLLRALVAAMVKNITLTSLDLSNNKITDEGACALGTLLTKEDNAIALLNLHDNTIREAGALAFGRALTVNRVLRSLDLSLNRLGDAGGQAVVDGLRSNTVLTSLALASNELGAETARALAESLKVNSTLTSLDVAGNRFLDDGGRMLLSAFEGNSSVLQVDVRQSGVGVKEEQALAALMQKRVSAQHMLRVNMVEARMREDIQRLVNERVRRSHGM